MKKTFDCVKMMRDIRTKLSRRYAKHPDLLARDLEEIRKKYGFPEPQQKPKTQLVAERQVAYGKGQRSGK